MISLSLVTTPNAPADLDARFGMATAVLNERLFVFAGGSWNVAPDAGVSGTFYTAPLYRRAGGADTRIALYAFSQDSGMRVADYEGQDGGFSSPGSPLAVGNLGQPSYLRVRPDVGGQFGSIVSDTFYTRIASLNPTITTSGRRHLVASSETQWSIVAADQMPPSPAALFWLPDGGESLSGSPTYQVAALRAGDGGSFTHALATNGIRHAAVLGPGRVADEWSLGSARVTPEEGQWALVVFGSGTTRFISLGAAARPPFDLSFGAAGGDAGLFVMANCSGDAGICAQPGSVVGFLPQP